MKRLSLHVVFVIALIIVFPSGPEQSLHRAFKVQYPPETHVIYSSENRREIIHKEIEETKRQNYNVILTDEQKPVMGRRPRIRFEKIHGASIISIANYPGQRNDAAELQRTTLSARPKCGGSETKLEN